MSHVRTAIVTTTSALALALALSACGSSGAGSPEASSSSASSSSAASSSPAAASSSASADLSLLSADDLLARSTAALKESSFRVHGRAVEDSESLAIDMTYFDTTSTGSITVSGGTISLEHVDGVSYFKADEAFWKASVGDEADQVIALFGDHWIKADNSVEGFADLMSIADPASKGQFIEPEGKVTLGKPKTIYGADCLTLIDTTGSEGDLQNLYVDASTALPVAIAGSDPATSLAQYEYDDLGAEPTAPTDAIDLAKLQSLAPSPSA